MEKFSKYQIKEQISEYFLTFLKQVTAPKTSELDRVDHRVNQLIWMNRLVHAY